MMMKQKKKKKQSELYCKMREENKFGKNGIKIN